MGLPIRRVFNLNGRRRYWLPAFQRIRHALSGFSRCPFEGVRNSTHIFSSPISRSAVFQTVRREDSPQRHRVRRVRIFFDQKSFTQRTRRLSGDISECISPRRARRRRLFTAEARRTRRRKLLPRRTRRLRKKRIFTAETLSSQSIFTLRLGDLCASAVRFQNPFERSARRGRCRWGCPGYLPTWRVCNWPWPNRSGPRGSPLQSTQRRGAEERP
jgi:hypothetical protein